eukprot:scpid78377/ scgid19532/ Nudix hydrolase 8
MASVLPHEVDWYNGAVVDLTKECPAEALFEDCLKMSLEEWKAGKRRGVWLQIGVANSYCIQIADKHGFTIHHAQPGYVMMTKWLPTDEPNLLPGYASHYVGVAGLVVDDQDQILVIKDKYARQPAWKLPGGMMDPGENIGVAVAREVFEETGIRAEFISIVSMRHILQYQFSRGDFYIACHMRPTTFAIKPCEHEISDCRWMKIEDYLSLSNSGGIYELNDFIVRSYLQQQKDHVLITPTEIAKRQCYTPRLNMDVSGSSSSSSSTAATATTSTGGGHTSNSQQASAGNAAAGAGHAAAARQHMDRVQQHIRQQHATNQRQQAREFTDCASHYLSQASRHLQLLQEIPSVHATVQDRVLELNIPPVPAAATAAASSSTAAPAGTENSGSADVDGPTPASSSHSTSSGSSSS